MLFWIICGLLTVVVMAAILAPFWRQRRAAADGTARPAGDAPAAAYDLQVYRDQLREVERDLARGVIGAEDAERLRAEIGRKVLDADRKLSAEMATRPRGRGTLAGAVLAVVLMAAGAIALYWNEGAPGLRDLPLSARLAEAEKVRANRPGQAELEAEAPPMPAPTEPVDPQFAELIEQLRQAVAQNPDDPQGLSLLARNEARLGNLDAARQAQERVVALQGDQADAYELTQLAAMMIQATGGIISPEAETVLARALAANPNHPQARYIQGLLYAQVGRPDLTFRVWAPLLEQGPPDAPWIPPIRESIRDLAWIAGEPDYQPPGVAMPAPSAGQVADAEAMTPEERQQMIAGMVEGLEARLATQGGSAEEWARLVTSLVTLGKQSHARDILAEARQRFADHPESAAVIDAAARQAGLAE